MFSKWRLLCSIFIILAILPSKAAEPLAEYKEARNMFLFAAACRASYDDLTGRMAVDALRSNGWEVEKYYRANKNANARFLLAVKVQPETNQPMYLVAITGTETIKDVIADLSYDKVTFAGHTVNELEDNAKNKVNLEKQPLVHWGFFQYVKAAWNIDYYDQNSGKGRKIFEELMKNPEQKIYLVGHSLGGAVATLGGASLINVGVDPSQIEVVTFGAPAVGNAVFRREFESKLNLTRVVMRGDPITSVLQDIVGGYEQFGKKVSWNTDEPFGKAHEMALYLDAAMKNYYKKRWAAEAAGEMSLPKYNSPQKEEKLIYVLELENNLPRELQHEFLFMKEAAADRYRDTMPAYYFAQQSAADFSGEIKNAVKVNCPLIVVPKVYAYKNKNERDVYTIVFEQTIFDTKSGKLVGLQTFSSTTRNMTPLEAFMHNAINMGLENRQWLTN